MEKVIEQRPATQSRIALHLMINQLSISNLPATIKNENTILNQVPPEMVVGTDTQKLAMVIGTLLSTVNNLTRNTTLSVSVKNYSDLILLHIKTNTRLNHPDLEKKLTRVQHLAEGIGGTIGFTSFRDNISTVALTFINAKVAC